MKIFYIIAGIILLLASCILYGFMDVIAARGFDVSLFGIVSLMGGISLVAVGALSSFDFKE